MLTEGGPLPFGSVGSFAFYTSVFFAALFPVSTVQKDKGGRRGRGSYNVLNLDQGSDDRRNRHFFRKSTVCFGKRAHLRSYGHVKIASEAASLFSAGSWVAQALPPHPPSCLANTLPLGFNWSAVASECCSTLAW